MAQENTLLNPATDFYKKLATDCSRQQVSVDMWLFSSSYADLATLSALHLNFGPCHNQTDAFVSQTHCPSTLAVRPITTARLMRAGPKTPSSLPTSSAKLSLSPSCSKQCSASELPEASAWLPTTVTHSSGLPTSWPSRPSPKIKPTLLKCKSKM